jgi:hypothetical protein
MSEMSEAKRDALWCRGMWEMLAEGGSWAVPRSGLIFTKREGKLMLTERMPHTDELMSEKVLRELQDEDFEIIRDRFQKIGVEVVKDLRQEKGN